MGNDHIALNVEIMIIGVLLVLIRREIVKIIIKNRDSIKIKSQSVVLSITVSIMKLLGLHIMEKMKNHTMMKEIITVTPLMKKSMLS